MVQATLGLCNPQLSLSSAAAAPLHKCSTTAFPFLHHHLPGEKPTSISNDVLIDSENKHFDRQLKKRKIHSNVLNFCSKSAALLTFKAKAIIGMHLMEIFAQTQITL